MPLGVRRPHVQPRSHVAGYLDRASRPLPHGAFLPVEIKFHKAWIFLIRRLTRFTFSEYVPFEPSPWCTPMPAPRPLEYLTLAAAVLLALAVCWRLV
jgi:hypothetical protein